MSKFNGLNPVFVLEPFREALGSHFDKVVNDCKSLLGRVQENNGGKDIVSKIGKVKISAKCVMSTTEGHKLALPANNPLSLILRDGQTLTILDEEQGNRYYENGKVTGSGIQSSLPKYLNDWFAVLADKSIHGKQVKDETLIPASK